MFRYSCCVHELVAGTESCLDACVGQPLGFQAIFDS